MPNAGASDLRDEVAAIDLHPDIPELTASPNPFESKFAQWFIPIIGLTLLLVCMLFVIAFIYIDFVTRNKIPLSNQDVGLAILLIHLAKLGGGFCLGAICFFLGTAACWLNLAGAFELDSHQQSFAITAKGANVGVLLIVVGLATTLFSLTRPISLTSEAISITAAEPPGSDTSSATDVNSANLNVIKRELAKLKTQVRKQSELDAIGQVLAIVGRLSPVE